MSLYVQKQVSSVLPIACMSKFQNLRKNIYLGIGLENVKYISWNVVKVAEFDILQLWIPS